MYHQFYKSSTRTHMLLLLDLASSMMKWWVVVTHLCFDSFIHWWGALYVEGTGIRNKRSYKGYSMAKQQHRCIGNVSLITCLLFVCLLSTFSQLCATQLLKIGSMEIKTNEETSLSLPIINYSARDRESSGPWIMWSRWGTQQYYGLFLAMLSDSILISFCFLKLIQPCLCYFRKKLSNMLNVD